jgi:hypothetical protein
MFEDLERIELAEEVFGTDFPVDLAEDLTVNNPREVFDYFLLHLKGWGPNSVAADFLTQLATKRNSPALAQGLHGSWRREQISAVIHKSSISATSTLVEMTALKFQLENHGARSLVAALLLRVSTRTIP